MAIFIDSLANVDSVVRRKFKKVFEKLSDDYLIRTPALEELSVAQIIIEGPNRSWLLIGYHPTTPTGKELTNHLQFTNNLYNSGFCSIKYLAVTQTGESLFDSPISFPSDIVIIERTQFFNEGTGLIPTLLTQTSLDQHTWIKKTLFPEVLVNPYTTIRRDYIVRDNTAKLQAFFLDYNQELATKLDLFEQLQRTDDDQEKEAFTVRIINGVAGCGKTLILVNRAILLCKRYPEQELLLLIHNKPITFDIKNKFEKYLHGIPRNLTIRTFHAFALAQQNRTCGRTKPLFKQNELKPIVDKILSKSNEAYNELHLSDTQIWSELEYINDYLIESKAAYLEYERQGRGFALQQSQRASIWQLYQESVAQTSSRTRGYLPSLYIKQMCLSDGKSNDLVKYDHILVDEAQFFLPAWLQLVKKSLKNNGHLYMCADPNQGFLKSRLSWKSIGLNVRGKTKRLNYSYRTTFEIMTAANTLLACLGENSEDFVKPDLHKMQRGSKPQVIYSSTPQDEKKRFLNEVKTCIDKGEIPLHQIMILCSNGVNPWDLKRVLETDLGRDCVVNCNDHYDLTMNLDDRIRLMNINSCTGMESGVTFVVGVGNLLNAINNTELNDDEREVVFQESIRKLYVAMTRAGQKLVLFSTESLPKPVEALVDIV